MSFNINGFERMLNEGNTYIEGYGHIDGPYDFYEYLWNEYEEGDSKIVTEFGDVELLNKGSSYDEGNQMMTVTFSVGDTLLQKEGYYSSWGEETRWDGRLTEVESYQEVVTRYRKKK